MSKIAVDVVLIPDYSMMDCVIGVSEKLAKKNDKNDDEDKARDKDKKNDTVDDTSANKLVLNRETCLPHISLAMGVIDETDLEKVHELLKEIALGARKFHLTVIGSAGAKLLSGGVSSWFIVEKTPEILALHEMVMKKLKQFLSYDVSVDMFFSPPVVHEQTPDFVRRYATHSSFENFRPHITIGVGELESIPRPITFIASTLAVCHLGSYCTCRKVLFSVKLKR